MVRTIENIYKLDDKKVTSIMLAIPREKFVPKKFIEIAYEDRPVPIGFGQTMSQPFTVAKMTHLLISANSKSENVKEWRVLEVGTGSGYQAAILSKLVNEVYTIEIIPELARRAKTILKRLGYKNVQVRSGSGEWGWQEKAPFDGIIITAALEKEVPKALVEQLKVGGVVVVPIGPHWSQTMIRFTKFGDDNLKKEKFGKFKFVPFIKQAN